MVTSFLLLIVYMPAIRLSDYGQTDKEYCLILVFVTCPVPCQWNRRQEFFQLLLALCRDKNHYRVLLKCWKLVGRSHFQVWFHLRCSSGRTCLASHFSEWKQENSEFRPSESIVSTYNIIIFISNVIIMKYVRLIFRVCIHALVPQGLFMGCYRLYPRDLYASVWQDNTGVDCVNTVGAW